MYELIQGGACSYYIESPTRVGLVRLSENDVCLIDAGSDRDAGRRIRQILDAQGWTLRAIFNTHSHADHIGGNKYLQTQTGCKIYAPGLECACTAYPLLEPMLLYGGMPPAALRHKFLLAQESDCEPLSAAALPAGMSLLPLPGHTPEMTGFVAPDGVTFLADCLSSAETLEKYRVSYLYDPGAYIRTLEKVQSLSAPLFVPAHAAASADIAPLARLNIENTRRVLSDIAALCAAPIAFDDLLAALFTRYALPMTVQQHALVGSTVRSCLASLTDSGALTMAVSGNRLTWAQSEGAPGA